MLTNELQKGDMVLLRNGWRAEVLSDIRTNTPVCRVFGFVTEAGSVYAHDILYKITHELINGPIVSPNGSEDKSGDWLVEANIEHTASQLRMREEVEQMF